MVIWVTGISGAGKTTICEALWKLLKPQLPELSLIDGDVVRDVFTEKLGYTEPDRVRQIQRIQALAKMLNDQKFVVLVAALYANPELLAWNRDNYSDYFEIYIKAPLWLVQERDPKGLYAKVEKGEMDEVVGIHIPWHEPENPDLVIDATSAETPEEIALRIAQTLPRLAGSLPETAA